MYSRVRTLIIHHLWQTPHPCKGDSLGAPTSKLLCFLEVFCICTSTAFPFATFCRPRAVWHWLHCVPQRRAFGCTQGTDTVVISSRARQVPLGGGAVAVVTVIGDGLFRLERRPAWGSPDGDQRATFNVINRCVCHARSYFSTESVNSTRLLRTSCADEPKASQTDCACFGLFCM